MKKMKNFLVALAILAFVTPAMADDMVTFKGSYDLAAVAADNVNEQNAKSDADLGDSDKFNYFYQRLRMSMKLQPTKGVSANLRFDFAEGIWGQDQDYGTIRPSNDDSQLQVDRAYVDINQDMFRLRAGIMFLPLGMTQVYRDNQPGIQLTIKTPTPLSIRLGYVKVNEGIYLIGDRFSRESDSDDENKDTDRFFIDLSYKSDSFKINGYYWMQTDGSTGDTDNDGIDDNFKDEPTLMGLTARTRLGGFDLVGELATFGGDNGNGVDYTGTQLVVAGTKQLNDSLALGLQTYYSSPQGSGEQKISEVGNPFAHLDMEFGGAYGWDNAIHARSNSHVFTSTNPPGGPIPGDLLNPFKTGTGSIGAGIAAKYKAMEKLTLIGMFDYLVAADDDIDGVTFEFEKGYNFLTAAVYQLAPNTSLHATYQNVGADFMDGKDAPSANVMTFRLHMVF